MKFDANSVEDKEVSFGPLPEGEYELIIDDAEETTSKAGNEMLKVTMTVVDKNRKVWDYFVFSNDVGKQRLKSLCNALEMPEGFEHESDLVDKVVPAKLKVDGDNNRVAWYITDDGSNKKVTKAAKEARVELDDSLPF